MSEAVNDRFVALAVYGTALVSVLASLVRPMIQRDWDHVSILALGTPLGYFALYALFGGSLALPFAILALRGTKIRWTVPIVAAPTIAASFTAGYLWTPFHAAFACLATGGAAMLYVRFLRPRHLTLQCNGPATPAAD